MTTIELTVLETILGGYGPVDSGTVSATYWAGNEPYLSVVGDEVRFPSEIKVQVIDGATVPLDMVPTRGVCCVRWVVRDHRSGHRLTRYTTIPDVPAVDFGDLIDVDPATFAPSAEGLAAWLAAIAEVQALVDQVTANTVTATIDPADDDVLLITFPSFQTDPDDGLILVLPIGA